MAFPGDRFRRGCAALAVAILACAASFLAAGADARSSPSGIAELTDGGFAKAIHAAAHEPLARTASDHGDGAADIMEPSGTTPPHAPASSAAISLTRDGLRHGFAASHADARAPPFRS